MYLFSQPPNYLTVHVFQNTQLVFHDWNLYTALRVFAVVTPSLVRLNMPNF